MTFQAQLIQRRNTGNSSILTHKLRNGFRNSLLSLKCTKELLTAFWTLTNRWVNSTRTPLQPIGQWKQKTASFPFENKWVVFSTFTKLTEKYFLNSRADGLYLDLRSYLERKLPMVKLCNWTIRQKCRTFMINNRFNLDESRQVINLC